VPPARRRFVQNARRMSARRVRTALCACVVVVALVVAAVAAAATRHTYKGRTAQASAISFAIKGRTLTNLRFSMTLNCPDGSTVPESESGFQAIRITSKGTFSDHQVGKSDDVRTTGKVRGTRVTGTVRVTDKISKTVTCGPGSATFTATRVKAKKKK
jgi:hypothetical protein